MAIRPEIGSVAATAKQQIELSSLFSITSASSDPAYLVVSGLDRIEYASGYNTAAMGTLAGNGATQKFANAGGDACSVGIVFTYQASSGQYFNASYGNFNQVTFTASSNTNDNTCLSVYGTNNSSAATGYAASPYVLEQNPSYFSYLGSVTVVTQPAAAGHVPTQATPNAICAAAQSFVGKAWNMNGCWVLASNISAEAGASLPASSTLVGVPGLANGEWIVAYNGPSSANASWEQSLVPGEMVGFVTTSGGGHITTVVSGAGSTATLIDNITYEYSNGTIQNAANDGSASDIIVAAAHAATQEFNGVNPTNVVVYELDTPTVHDLVSSLTLAERATKSMSTLFAVSNPLASQAITEYQVYDTNTADSITLNGVAQTADHSAAAAANVSSLTAVSLLAGAAAGSDTIEIRAFNGSYFGDWQSLAVTITAPSAPPTVTSQTASQTWKQGQKINLALPANTFTDPQGQTLTYAATQSNGQALPSWLSFNASTKTFSGTVPAAAASFSLKVTATDTAGLSASETFGATVPAAAGAIIAARADVVSISAANTSTSAGAGKMTYISAPATARALPSDGSHGAAFFGSAAAIIQPLVTALGRVTNATPRLDPPASYGRSLLVNPPSLSGIIAGMVGSPHHAMRNFI